MFQRFSAYCIETLQLRPDARLLLAVSGGIDSVALLHLAHQSGMQCVVAHCNFGLRGAESDGDETFVRELAERYEMRIYMQRFDTAAYAERRKMSIQVAARILRYEWLEQMRNGLGLDYVLTAHHLNDSIETMLFNMARGTGIRGLTGIAPVQGRILRPLLFATRQEIEAYAQEEGLPWREDSSNQGDYYSRNFIRHHVVPKYRELFPSFEKSAANTIHHLREAEAIYQFGIRHWMIKATLTDDSGLMRIRPDLLRQAPAPVTLLWEFLRARGFNYNQIEQLYQHSQTGNAAFSKLGYILEVRDKEWICYPGNENEEDPYILISEGDTQVNTMDGELRVDTMEGVPGAFARDNNIAWLDAHKCNGPMILRRWRKGDWFCPFGMGGNRQLVSDYFTNIRLSARDKKKVWLLTIGGQIAWIVGYRSDERYRLSEHSTHCVRLEWQPATR